MRPACLKGLATGCQRAAAEAGGSALWNSSPHTCNHKHLPSIAPRGRRGHSGHSRTTCKRKVNTGGLEKHLQMFEGNMQKRKKTKQKQTYKKTCNHLFSLSWHECTCTQRPVRACLTTHTGGRGHPEALTHGPSSQQGVDSAAEKSDTMPRGKHTRSLNFLLFIHPFSIYNPVSFCSVLPFPLTSNPFLFFCLSVFFTICYVDILALCRL